MKNHNIDWPNVPALPMEPGQTATTDTAVLPGRPNDGPKLIRTQGHSLLRYATLIAAMLLTLSTALAFAQPVPVPEPRFINVAVSRCNLYEFSDPAEIENHLAIVFEGDAANFDDSMQGTVFDWLDRKFTSIVSSAWDMVRRFDRDYIVDAVNKITYVSDLLREY